MNLKKEKLAMIEYNSSAIRMWSILGSRGAFGVALNELAQSHPEIIALSADLCTTSGLDRFKNSYSDRFVNVGIAEQNMVGIAAGMASMSYIPFATTFSNFASLRSCEQMRHFMGYMKENVKIVGLGAGFAMGMFGVTHYGLEDIASIRAIPNITILSPADCTETVKMTQKAFEIKGPVYLRLTGVMNAPIIYKKDYEIEIGKTIPLNNGDDLTIFATGSMVNEALKASEILKTQGISAAVEDVHTIKPLDTEAIERACSKKMIVTIEEHSVIGGLGSAVSETLSRIAKHPMQLTIGVENNYPKAGSYQYLVNFCGLSADSIAEKIKKKYKEVNRDE